MKDAITVVTKGWYHLYFGLAFAFCVALVGGYFAVKYMPGLERYGNMFALGRVTLAVAAVPVVYGIVAYWLIGRRNPALAALVGTMLFAFVLLNGLTRTDGEIGNWLYVGAWVACMAFVAMYGFHMLLATFVLALTYLLLNSQFQVWSITPSAWTLLVGSVVIGLLSYPFWRRQYINPAQHQLNQLANMLRSNQEQSAILIQSIADGVIVINTEGKITLINPAAASMTQWPVSEALGIDAQLVVKLAGEKGEELPDEKNPFRIVLSKQTRVNGILQLSGRDDRKMLVSLVISPISIGESNTQSRIAGAVAVMRDISSQRAEEQQRADFISTASHEMRTPVAAIEGYLALALNDKVSTVDSRARGFLEKAHASTQHLGQLFQDLLTSAKAEDGRLSNHPSVIEMGVYLQQLVEDLRFAAQKKGLQTEFVVGAGEAIDATNPQTVDATTVNSGSRKVIKPLYYVYADPDRLREVITNLFDNACKYTDQGKVSIGLTGNNDVVQFYIRDTGAGIPAEDIPHLFQKFYRVDNSATRTIGGTGLGLFISRKIIELYQGRIWVESAMGKGSTFFINLPRLSSQRATQLQANALTGQTANTAATPSKT